MFGGGGVAGGFILCGILTIFVLKLFDCERRRRGRRGGASSLFARPSVSVFSFQRRRARQERRGGGQTFSGLSGIISQP